MDAGMKKVNDLLDKVNAKQAELDAVKKEYREALREYENEQNKKTQEILKKVKGK